MRNPIASRTEPARLRVPPAHALTAALLAVSLAACDSGELNNPDATINLRVDVTGLEGTVRLYNAGVGSFAVTGSGNVTVGTHVLSGSGYAITVVQQPAGQTCVVTDGNGVANGALVPVQVGCAATQYPVAVAVTGQTGGELVLRNGSETLTVTADGTHAFPTAAAHGDAYDVILDTEPVGHSCTITGGTGVANAPITGISVACTAVDPFMIRKVTVAVTGPKFLTLNWQTVPGATHYKLMRDNDGIPGGARTQVGTNTAATTLTDRVAIHLRTGYLYSVDACDALHCVESVPVSATGELLRQAIGYFKADWHYQNGYFGWQTALSSDGQTLAVGSTALGAYAFVRPTNAYYWKQQGRMAFSAPGTFDTLGYDVALSADGRLMAVSTREYNGVRIYERNLGVWGLKAQVVPSGGNTQNARLAMSADGSVLAMTGMPQAQGCAQVYRRNGNAWILSEGLACISALGHGWGNDVALSADGLTLVVGSSADPGEGVGVNPVSNPATQYSPQSRGAARVFAWSGTAWVQQALLKPMTTGGLHYYGKSVAISSNGNVVAVGVPGDDNSRTGIDPAIGSLATHDSGAVYVYARNGSTWSQQAYIKAYVTDSNDNFGFSVSLSGDGKTLAVGAPDEDSAGIDLETGTSLDDSAQDAGAAYVFTRTTAWKQARYIKAPFHNDPYPYGNRFGYSVALSTDGATLAVGAVYESGDALGINGDMSAITDTYAEYGATYLY